MEPAITGLNVLNGTAGTVVTLTGTAFGASQLASTLTLGGVTFTPSAWSDGSITVTIPSSVKAGVQSFEVTVNGEVSDAAVFTVAPSLGTVSPSAGTTSTSITVTGTNFGSDATGNTITIGGVSVAATAWSTTSITFVVPALPAGDQNIEVVVGGQSSGTAVYTVQPFVGSVSPSSATGGTLVSITGNTFGLTDVGNSVTVGGIVAAIDSWSDSLIEFTMPGTVTGGTRNVVVTVNGEASTVGSITVVPAITSPSPVSGPTGTNLTLAGTGFGAGQGASTMTLSGSPITPTSWSSTSLALMVPGGLAAGDHAILVTVGGQTSAAASFTVTPFISNVSPSPVTGGTTVTVTGTSFGTGQGGSSLLVDGVSLVGSAWTDLSLNFDLPTSVTAGTVPVSVVVNGEYSNVGTFIVDPSIYALTPVTGAINSTVTLTGANFGATKGASTITVDGITATTTAWSSTSVDITIPASLTAGSYDVVALINGRTSNSQSFDIAAGIASVTPGSGSAGTWITVSGTAFGASQGGNEITVGGVAVVPATWSTTSIQFSIPATVPAGAGSISLTIGGQTTTYLFTVDVGTLSLGSTDATGGDSVIITGANFGTNPAGVSVTVGGVLATVNSVGATSIDFEMPGTVTGGTQNVIVTVNGEVSAPESINVTPTLISALPASRTGGESITLTGTNLGASSGDGTVLVGGVTAPTTFWSQTSIVATMPNTVTAGTRDVWAVIGGETSGTQSITVMPSLGTFTPTTSSAGNSIVLSGTNFGGAQGASTFTLAGIAVTTSAWSQTSISWTVPNGSPVGSQPVVLTVGGQTVNTNFTVTIGISLAPTSGTGGDTVTINGTGFGADDNGGASTVTIAGVPVTTSSWSDTAIQFQVPVTISAGAQPVTVTVGAQNNSAIFTVNPAIVSLTPGSGTGGAIITLAGTNLGATQLASTITVDGIPVSITSWSTTSVQFEIPDSVTAGTRTVSITVGGQTDTFSFDVEPSLGGLSAGTGTGGTTVSATGTNLGSTQGSSSILIAGVPVTVTNWYASVVTFTIPNNVTAGVQSVAFNVGSQLSNTSPFTVQPTLVGPVSPTSGTTSTVVTIGGTNFGTDATGNTITIGGVSVAATAWSMTSISFAVPVLPAGDATITVEVGGEMSNAVTFTVQPFVGSIAPSSATGGTLVTITGTSFGPTDVGNSVTIGGIASAIVSWSDTSIQFTMPDAVTGGTRGVVVTVNGEASTVGSVTVVPAITSPSPVSGPTGTNLTLSGTGFGAGQGASTMTLSGSPITPTSWSSTSLALTVPGGLAAGDHTILVTVGGQTSAAATFTVTPFVSNISPSPVTGGTTVTVTGTSFGTGQGGSSLLVDGVSLVGSAWTDLSLNFDVPTSVTAGTVPVSVIVNGEYSNIGTFVVDPSIYALTPVTGAVNSTVTLTGANFGATKGASTITVDGITATTTAWSSTSVDITVPASLTAGSYDVVATVGGQASNAATFNIAAGIASVTPGSGAAGTWITVSGTAFGASQGGNEITVGDVAVVPATWSTTTIQFSIPATVPAGAGSISLTIGGLTTTYLFTVDVGTLSLGSTDATGGDSVIITGTNFGTNPVGVSVSVGGVAAVVNSVGPTSIDFEMPDTVTGGTQNVIVTVNGEVSAPESINVTPTLISALPASRTGGESITLTGTNLGASVGDGTVLVGGISAATTFWSQTSITATMPNTVTAGTRNVWVVIGGETSGTQSITVTPTLGTLTPTSAVAGSTVVLAGTNFGGVPTGSTFTLAGIAVTSTAWSQTSISWKVPIGTPVGSQPLVLTVDGQMVSTNFTVVIGISLSPTSGTGSDTVTISGSGFGADDNGGASTVTIANILVVPLSWSDTEIQFQVPNTAPASAQPVTVTVGAQNSSAMFTISPSIVSLSPTAGTGSTPVTLAGTNLGAAQLGSTIEIGGSLIVPTSWSSTSIDFMVPSDLAAGSHPVTVTVEGLADTFFFDVEPFVGGIDIATGTGGTVVTATGTNYGAAQGASNVYVSGVAAPILNWYPSVVTFSIPNDVTAGVQGIVFDVGGQLSDPAIPFTVSPTQDNVSPASGTGGTIVVLSGTNFGLSQGASALSLGGVSITADVWSQVAVTFTVPATIAGGIQTLALTVNGQAANNLSFTVAPRVTNVTPAMGSALTDVTVTGNGFGTVQGASMVHIGGIPIAVTDWYANVITFTIADSVTGGTRNLTVTVGGETSNATPFVIVPIINSLTPNTGTGLTSVTVSGANFGAGLGTSTVSIGGALVSPSLWSNTSFTFAVPTTLAAGTPSVVVTVGGQSSAGTVFTLNPSITSLNPTSGSVPTPVTVTGTNFGLVQGTISLGGVGANVTGWSPLAVTFTVPSTIAGGSQDVIVTAGGQSSDPSAFSVKPLIDSLSPSIGVAGTSVTVSGSHFGTPIDTIAIGGFVTTATGWSPSAVTFSVPNAVTAGVQGVVVTVSGVSSDPSFFDVLPTLSSLSPNSGTGGDSVTIYGANFGSVADTLAIGGVAVVPFSWSTTAVVFVVPNNVPAGTRAVDVTVAGFLVSSNFDVKPSITGTNPLFGSALTEVTVGGTNFGSAGDLSLGGISLATSSWNNTAIVYSIPATIEAGIRNIVVTSGSQTSNAFAFTVTPSIKTLSPNSGAGGTVVTIDGTNFGAAQDVTSTVTIGGLGVTPTGWNDTTIVFTVPDSVTSGTQAVVVTVGGQTASKDFIIAPVISSLNPTSGVIATPVTITGKNFGASEGASIITIDGVVATASGWSPLAVTFTVPAAITGGTHNVLVTVAGQVSNPSSFSVIPSISIGGLAPNTGPGGTAVTISGNNYGGAQGASTVWVDGIAAMVSSWSSSSVAITMPNDVTAGTRGVVVRVGGEDSAASNFTVTPAISSLSAPSGVSGTTVTITGTNFGDSQSGGTVTIAGIQSVVDSWAMTSIDIRIPSAVTAGTQNIVVTAQGQVSNGEPFIVGSTLTGLNPLSGTGGDTVTISGVNFGDSLGASTLSIGGFAVVPSNWYPETVTFTVPTSVTGGTQNVVLTIGGVASNALPFTVVPTLTSLSTLTGPGGTSVTLSGTNFGAAQGLSTVAVDGISATITSWGASSVIIDMPDVVTAGTRGVVLTAGGQASNAINFTVTPAISSLSVLIGSGGTPVTITGTNFGGSALPGTVTVGGVAASVGSWDMTSISITIPNAATGGTQNVVVTSFAQASNPATFAVTPTISGLNPVSGTGGDSVTISGTNFGTVAGSVNIGGFIAITSGWYGDTVTFAVPAAVTAGTQNVFVSIGGQDSNTSIFTVAPSITGLSPASGIGGTYVTISGTNFGATEGSSTVNIGGFFATATTWSGTSVVFTIPNAVTAGTQNLVVTVSGQTVSTPITVRPAITVLTLDNGTGNDSVVITGTGFGVTQGASTLTVAGVLVGATAWDSTSISFTMPTSITAQTAAVVVTVASQASAASDFLLKPNFTLISPDNGNTASTVTLTGTNFGTVQGGSTVLFGVASAPITGWYNNTITATVPISLSSAVYTVTVVVGGQTSPGLPFTATSAFLVASAETLDCQPVDGHIDHYKLTYNEAVNDSTFEGYVLNTTGSVTARWEVAGRLNVRLQHGTSVPAACGTDVNNDTVHFLKFDPDTAFDTGETPDITVTAALVTALAAPAGRTMFGTGTFGSTDLAETDKAGPFVYYARGAEAGAAESLVGPGDTLEIRFSETTNAAVLAGIDLDTVFALTTFFDFGGAGDIAGTVWTQTDVTNDTLVVTFATLTPTVAIGNTIKARGTDIFDLAFNIPAAIADVLTPPVIAGTFEAGPVGPYVTDADYYDIDADGHLDHVRVVFSASVVDNTFPGYVDTSTVGAVTILWLVAGHSSVAMDPTVAADVDNDNVIWLSISESSSFDTGVKPDLTATADVSQLRDSVGCYFNANNVGTACTDSAKALLASADVNEGDKAPPIIMHATGKAGSDKVFILFSENVWGAPGRPSCGAGGEFTVADFSYGDIIPLGATSFVTMDNDVCGATDALISINTDVVLDPNDVNFDLAKPNSGASIYDQADNAMAAATSRVIEGTTAPYLVGASSFKVGASFFLRVVYSEDVNATDALTATNYSVIEDPASTCVDIAATPTSVSQVSGNIYDIETGTQCGFTPLTFYRVTVTNVTDSNEGELIGVPNIATTLGTDTADVTPPRLLEAKAITPTTVQLTFSEPMKTGNVNGTAECAAAGFPITCAVDADAVAGGTQLKYTLLPTLGAVTSVLKTANSSVFLLTHASIQSGTFYSVTAVDTATVTGQLLDASTPGVRIGSVPRNQATFQGMGALITQATDGPLFSDPFGDGTTNNFAFTYASRVYIGPNGPNNGEFRFEADGANPLSVEFVGPSVGATCLNSVSFGVTGGTVCTTPSSPSSTTPIGPNGEKGVVGFNAGAVTVAYAGGGGLTTTREVLMVGPIKGNVSHMYFSEDIDTSLNFNQCSVVQSAGNNTQSIQIAYSWGSNMYVGISSGHNTAAPFLNKIPLTAASATAPLACGATVDLNIKDVPDMGNTGGPNNPARGGAVGNVGIDSMIYVPSLPTPANRFYIANNGGMAASTGEPTSNLSFTTFKNQASFAAAHASAGDDFTLIVDSLGKVSPGRKGIPQMVAYKNVLFMARNVATNQSPGTVSNGGELWKCSANCTTAASWTRIVSSTTGIGGNTGMEIVANQAISMLQVSQGYLYVGFDNMTDGARMYRTSVVPSSPLDFVEVGRIASGMKPQTGGAPVACPHAQSLGGICMGYQILSSSVIVKNQYSYIYFTAGCTLLTASADGQTCDINPAAAAVALPAMSVLIQRD